MSNLAKAERVSLGLAGLHCAACVRRVENILGQQKGILKATVNLASSKALIIYEPGSYDFDLWAQAIGNAGFELLSAAEKNSHLAERRQSEDSVLKKRFLIALALSVVGWPLSMPGLLPLNDHLASTLAWLLATLVVLFPGRQFFVLAWKNFGKSADMNTLVALGAGTAYLYSSVIYFSTLWAPAKDAHAPHLYLDSLFMIITLILLGRLLEGRARHRASGALEKLLSLAPKETMLVAADGTMRAIPVEMIVPGDILLARPSETLVVDGFILEHPASLNESLLTGEALPVEKEVGAQVFGGTQNVGGPLLYEATGTGETSALGRIINLVEEAQGSKPPIQELADRVVTYFVPVVLLIGLVTLVGWLLLGAGSSEAITRLVAVLVVACPCAMGLATPTAVMVGAGRGADLGLWFKDAKSLEMAAKITHLALDKTGTITQGHPQLTTLLPLADLSRDELLRRAAQLERSSEHPLAQAVVHAYELAQSPQTLAWPEDFKVLTGFGVQGQMDGSTWLLGRPSLLAEKGFDLTSAHGHLEALAQKGETPALLGYIAGEKQVVVGVLGWSDLIKPESKEALARLKEMKIETMMLTGDSKAAAEHLANDLNLNYQAELKPEDKLQNINALKGPGRTVAMVGDGLNDAPALATADLGIAMGAGAEVTLEAAGLTLLTNNLNKLPEAIGLGRATMRAIKQNLFWAFFYNILTIPLAAGLYDPWGLTMSPSLCAGVMALSSLSVVSNSLRLKYFNSRP